METNYLKEFIAFSKTMSFAQASEELYISQPTLRAHLKTIEDELGSPLTLKRDGRLDLSPAGKFFLKKAREIVEFSESAFEECREYSKGAVLVTASDLGYTLFDEMLDEARVEYGVRNPGKNIDVRLSQGMRSNIESLQNESVDLALFSHVRENQGAGAIEKPDFPEGIASFYYSSEETVFWATKESPLFEKDAVAPDDLEGLTLLLGNSQNMISAGESIKALLASKGSNVSVNNCPFVSYYEYLFSGTPDSFGISYKGASPQRSDFRIFEIEGCPIESDLFVLCNIETMGEDGMRFFEVLEDIACRHQPK